MSRYLLDVHPSGEKAQRVRVPSTGIVIGRSPEVDVVVADPMISRRHIRLWVEDGILNLEDLGSKNGIQYRGQTVRRLQLTDREEFHVGHCMVRVCEEHGVPGNDSSIISHQRASHLCTQMVEDPNESSRFPILYRAAQLLGTIFDLDDLLKQILDIIFEALPAARRGYVITFSDDINEAKVRASNLRDDEPTTLPLSTTLIDYVFTEKNAILTRDAQEDSRFQGAQSIIGHAIHAAMCAPLRGRQAVVGAIYVDSGSRPSNFTESDLQLLTVLAQVVGVAVENARLYQASLEQERLVAIGQATAGIGHCVKNILTGLLGGAQFVDMALDKKDLRYIEKGWPIIRRAVERIEMLMLNMLSFSKNREPDRSPTDLNALIEEVLDTIRPRAEKKNIVLGVNQTGLVHAYVDSREIYRVILNLVVNAIDACEGEGGSVTVSASAEPSGCYIEVRDTGVGIPPELMPKLFQAFVTTKGSNGTGLGLACSSKIVREHGGVIHLDSEVGKGTKVTVFLPVEQNGPTRLHAVRED